MPGRGLEGGTNDTQLQAGLTVRLSPAKIEAGTTATVSVKKSGYTKGSTTLTVTR